MHGFYRQFRKIGKKGSHLPANQQARWEQMIQKWELASSEGLEIISMGDTNLNYNRWNIQASEMNSYDRTNKPMSTSLQDRILNHGTVLLDTKPTRTKDNPNDRESCLDMMFTNRPEKIICHQAGLPGFSDHTIQTLTRTTRKIETSIKYMRIRSFQNFSQETYKDNIPNHHLYIETNYEQEPDKITANIQTIMQDSLQLMAPVKIIQMSKNKNIKLSQEIKEKMAERDLARIQFLKSNHQEDFRNHKN